MPRPCALIAGASGVVGRAVARTLAESSEWDVVPLSRSPAAVTGARAIAVDLSSPADTRDRLSALTGVTHLIYCARATHTMALRESVEFVKADSDGIAEMSAAISKLQLQVTNFQQDPRGHRSWRAEARRFQQGFPEFVRVFQPALTE